LAEWTLRSVPRFDGESKAAGELEFLSDLFPDGCLYASTVRSPHPRARVLRVDVSKAAMLPGVRAALTAKDVPGLNAYGVFVQEAPVLAEGMVNYVGQPVALVAASTEEGAERAAQEAIVSYEPLKPVSSIEEALAAGAPKLHPSGNVARHGVLRRGDLGKAMKSCFFSLKATYRTQKQKHMFIEPEGGLGYVDEKGVLNLFVGGQSPYRDRLQVARSLNMPKEKIRVVSYPVGGAFGGKDDITVQIHLALLALKTKKPVRLVWTREESGEAGYMRHEFLMKLETGVDKGGHLLANKAVLLADTGPYQSFGPAVLDVAMENINGPYLIPNYFVDATLVRTNNGISAAFRGFGAPQANFAIEGQINAIAEELGMDRLELRRINLWRSHEEGNFGKKLGDCDGLRQCLERASASELWRTRRKHVTAKPWRKRGVGVALAVKGLGFGTLPDYATAAAEVDPDGFVVIYFSNPDYGQGLVTANAQLVAEKLQLPSKAIHVSDADSGSAPDTGSSSASRSTYTAGNALLDACEQMLMVTRVEAAAALKAPLESIVYTRGSFTASSSASDAQASISIFEVARLMRSRGLSTKFEGTFAVPRHDSPVSGSLEIPHLIYDFAALVGEVEVDELTGFVRATRFAFFPDVGRVVNPVLASAQCDGGIIQGLGYALMEEHIYEKSIPKTKNFTTYLVPSPTDSPDEIYTEFVRTFQETGPFGAKGVGEIPIVPVASCLADAIRDATGVTLRELPMKPERVLSALRRRA